MIKLVLSALVMIVLTYAVFAFVAFDANAGHWSFEARAWGSLVSLTATLAIWGIMSEDDW